MTDDNIKFSTAYKGLKDTVEKLRNGNDEDIDILFEHVDYALKCKDQCMERLNIIKKMIEDREER